MWVALNLPACTSTTDRSQSHRTAQAGGGSGGSSGPTLHGKESLDETMQRHVQPCPENLQQRGLHRGPGEVIPPSPRSLIEKASREASPWPRSREAACARSSCLSILSWHRRHEAFLLPQADSRRQLLSRNVLPLARGGGKLCHQRDTVPRPGVGVRGAAAARALPLVRQRHPCPSRVPAVSQPAFWQWERRGGIFNAGSSRFPRGRHLPSSRLQRHRRSDSTETPRRREGQSLGTGARLTPLRSVELFPVYDGTKLG